MRRGETGKYQITNHSGEQVRAYIPAPLPPDPPIAMDGLLQQALESASLALGRLDSISVLLPDPALFIYTYVRKEALLSSQIEGTQSSLSELLMFENDQVQGVLWRSPRQLRAASSPIFDVSSRINTFGDKQTNGASISGRVFGHATPD